MYKIKKEKQIDLLLKEYELCQHFIQHKESSIWQTFAVLGVASFAALVLVAKADFFVIFVVGLSAISSIWIWWRMANRWWDIQHTNLLRMFHIEQDLDCIYQIRYVKYRDGQLKVSDSKLSAERWNDLKQDPKFKKKGVKKALICFPITVTVIWCLYLLYFFHSVFQKWPWTWFMDWINSR